MQALETCPECGVPRRITGQYLWLNSGAVVMRSNPGMRVGFLESENLDPLYRGISEAIGLPIDRLVRDVMRKGTLEYARSVLPPDFKDIVRSGQVSLETITENMTINSHMNGFGKMEHVELVLEGGEDDRYIVRVTDPFSVYLYPGVHAASMEIFSDYRFEVDVREISPGTYEMKAYVSHKAESEERLQLKEYRHREGDAELEKCPTCGGPAALADFCWRFDQGVIFNDITGKRMVMLGPEAQDPLFQELEYELGEVIPSAVIETQKRFTKSGFHSSDLLKDPDAFRVQLALRGLGNLREMRSGPDKVSVRIDNAANVLMTVGMMEGLYEMEYGKDAAGSWELTEEGDLLLEVIPRI